MATADDLEILLDHVKESRGFDFGAYKRTSLARSIDKRMQHVGVVGYADYRDYLEVHPHEFPHLFNTILINVTAFFRDAAAWQYLAETTIPSLLEDKGEDAPIRVWTAGCASGEETYTLAILLAEALGEEEYQRRVKIYATDVDDEALSDARQGLYSAKQIEPVPPELLERYFERNDGHAAFRKDLRRTVIFGRNDLVQDAPISRVDLLLCRNTLMYLNAEVQAHILRRFHFALNATGYLFLGRSEMLIRHTDLFAPSDLKRRVFTKVPKPTLRDRIAVAAHHGDAGGGSIRDTAFDTGPTANLIVDREGMLVQANHAARRLLGIVGSSVGRPVKQLEAFHRPVEVREHLAHVMSGGANVTLPPTDFGGRALVVAISPLLSDGDEIVGASVVYTDRTDEIRARTELASSRRELAAAYNELHSTVQELESTNKELQSTNEDLETTNEELQSTNEELETTNEELQSSNEELETMNDELRERGFELNEVNAFMETILTSMGAGVMVVDRDQTVRVYNTHSEELWGLRAAEVEGKNILNLDIGLPVGRLDGPLRDVLSGASERERIEAEAVDRRGRTFRCQATVLPMSLPGDGVTGAIVLTERVDGRDGG